LVTSPVLRYRARIVHDSRASDDMKRKRRRVYQTRIVGCIAQR
jgi:hypothetical protein